MTPHNKTHKKNPRLSGVFWGSHLPKPKDTGLSIWIGQQWEFRRAPPQTQTCGRKNVTGRGSTQSQILQNAYCFGLSYDLQLTRRFFSVAQVETEDDCTTSSGAAMRKKIEGKSAQKKLISLHQAPAPISQQLLQHPPVFDQLPLHPLCRFT